jgi:hypothetical protein
VIHNLIIYAETLSQTAILLLDNTFSQRVNAIVQKTREMRRGVYYPHIYVVKEDSEPALRLWALSTLVQDRADVLPSYQQFIGQLRDKVRRYFSLLSFCGEAEERYDRSTGPIAIRYTTAPANIYIRLMMHELTVDFLITYLSLLSNHALILPQNPPRRTKHF